MHADLARIGESTRVKPALVKSARAKPRAGNIHAAKACAHRSQHRQASPSSGCRHLLPARGAKGHAAPASSNLDAAFGTSPLPVFTGVRRTGRDEWLGPGNVRVRGSHRRKPNKSGAADPRHKAEDDAKQGTLPPPAPRRRPCPHQRQDPHPRPYCPSSVFFSVGAIVVTPEGEVRIVSGRDRTRSSVRRPTAVRTAAPSGCFNCAGSGGSCGGSG